MSHLNKSKLAITVIMNVLLISLFIGIFFFTYGSYIEGKIVNNQMEFLSSDISNIVRLFGENTNNNFKEKIKTFILPDLHEEDKKAKESNNKIMMKALKVNIFFAIAVIIAIYVIYITSKKDFSMGVLIKQNLILLLFVALTEFSFITFFVSDFVSIDPNNIKYNFVKNLESLKD